MTTDQPPRTDAVTPSRRTFLTGAALTGVAVGASALSGRSATAAPMPALPTPAAPRSRLPTASCGLEFDGAAVGGMQSVSGGALFGELLDTKSKGVRRKVLADITAEDFTVTAGTGMSAAFYRAVATTVENRPRYRTVRITTRDPSGALIEARRASDALISEVVFPTLDSTNTGAALLTLKIALTADVFDAKAGPAQPTPATEHWLCHNFRLRIAGIDCSQVSHIQSLSARIPVHSGLQNTREPTASVVGQVEYSNLVITMPASRAGSLREWGKSFLVDAKRDKRSGRLEFLSDTAKVLFTVKLPGLSIFRLEPSPVSASSNEVPFVTASMFFNQMSFTYSSAAVG
jgi:hypothetical protein